MHVSKKPYSLDEYYKDKYGGQTAVSPLSTKAAPFTREETYSSSKWARPAPVVNASSEVIVRPPHTVQKPTSGTVDVGKPDTGAGTGGGTLTQSQLTTADTMRMMEDAMASLAEWGNRKFVYNAKESPLYTILQQQAEKEARLASGRAYSRAVANTGGFGSSYATLAAEEAGRQVMEGLDDQQLALYQAAREEFEAERQSRVDWYNTAKQLHNDRMALDELQAIEAAAKASGMNTDTYNLLQTAVAEGWYDGTNKATVRNKLETMALGNPNINVDAIMTQLEGGQSAAFKDAVNSLSINTTLSGAAEIMAQAKAQGMEAEVLPQVSASVSKGFTGAMADPSTAYSLMGMDAATWNEMFAEYTDPNQRAAAQKAYVLEAAGEARKSGMLSGDDYVAMLTADVNAELEAIDADFSFATGRETADIAVAMANYRDMGYLTDEEYGQMLDKINEKRAASMDVTYDLIGAEYDIAEWVLKAGLGEKVFGFELDNVSKLPFWVGEQAMKASKDFGISDETAPETWNDMLAMDSKNKKDNIYNLNPYGAYLVLSVLGDAYAATGVYTEDEIEARKELVKRELKHLGPLMLEKLKKDDATIKEAMKKKFGKKEGDGEA